MRIWPVRSPLASGHAGDDELAVLALAGADAVGTAVATHVLGCAACTDRLASLEGWLEDSANAAGAEADLHFPSARLDRQRAAIMRRLAGHKGAARVLAFPAPQAATPVRHRVARRYIAAAAVAGLLVGAVAGRFLYPHNSPMSPARSQDAGTAPRDATLTTTQIALAGDEAFLSDFEAALGGPRVAPLQALDALTPRVADERAR